MKLRIDRVRGGSDENPIDRWQLLAGGRLVLTLEAEDLHALTAEAMRADGQRQGLVLVGAPPLASAPAYNEVVELIEKALGYLTQVKDGARKAEAVLMLARALEKQG